MLISSREAADLLAPLGIGRESVRRVLEFGLARPVQETKAARLFERSRVAALLDWPAVRAEEIVEPAGQGVFVPRLGNHFGTFEEASSGPSTIGRQPGRTCTFTLTEAGSWFIAFEGHRLPTGPGSAWRWWQPRDGRLPALQE